jgi:hypothetical protein
MFYFKDYLHWGPLSTEESFTLEEGDNYYNSGQSTVEHGYNDTTAPVYATPHYSVSYPVISTSSSLLTIPLHFSAITRLVYNDQNIQSLP